MEGARRRRTHKRRHRGGDGFGDDELEGLRMGKFAKKGEEERDKELAKMSKDRAKRHATSNAAVTLSGKLFPGSTSSSAA